MLADKNTIQKQQEFWRDGKEDQRGVGHKYLWAQEIRPKNNSQILN